MHGELNGSVSVVFTVSVISWALRLSLSSWNYTHLDLLAGYTHGSLLLTSSFKNSMLERYC